MSGAGAAPFQKRILEAIRSGRRFSTREFNALALETYAHQFGSNSVYRRFCEASGAGPNVKDWRDIPALPVSAFKAADVVCFNPKKAVRTFETSGTTLGGRRGRHFFETLDYYDAAIRTFFKKSILPDVDRIRIASLVPQAGRLASSSLSHMASVVIRAFGEGEAFEAVRDNEPQFGLLSRHLEKQANAGKPVLIFSTSLALAGFLDFLGEIDLSLKLAKGSRIMETGGFKGKDREVPRRVILALAEKRLGVKSSLVVNEYGMTELSTQFYGGAKTDAPWSRTRVMDARGEGEVRAGGRGLIRILDLANQGSCACIQTEDEGRRRPGGGFEVLGRRKGSDLRGCSLTFEEMERVGASV